MASWFYLIMLGTIFLVFAISVQQFALAVMAFDLGLITFWGKVPEVTYPLIALINIIAIANAYFYKPFSPRFTS